MINELIKLSPVPVKFTNTIIFNFNGIYWHSDEFEGKPHIEIGNHLTKLQKAATLVHEIKHAKCVNRNCKCMKNPDKTEREIHAYICELRWLLRHRQKITLKNTMKILSNSAKNNNDHYSKAAKHIMKLQLWHKCLEYVANAGE